MDIVDTSTLWRFAAEKMQKVNLFETDRMFCDLYCFEPGQTQAPHSHVDSDKVYFVLSGHGRFQVGGDERHLGPNQSTIAPAGAQHGVVNDSAERLVLLVFMAPHPGRRPIAADHSQ